MSEVRSTDIYDAFVEKMRKKNAEKQIIHERKINSLTSKIARLEEEVSRLRIKIKQFQRPHKLKEPSSSPVDTSS